MRDEFRKYDMNLLRAFVTVYETRSVTEAAERLMVSQPSISFALAKLRKLFADPLFQRGSKGLQATRMATGLYPEICQAIRMMDSAVQGISEFDPATTHRKFRLMMTDLGLMALFPYIVTAFEAAAPHARIEVEPLDISLLHDRLMRNEVDAAIGIPVLHDVGLLRTRLMEMPYVGVCSASHARIGNTPSLEDIRRETLVAVSNTLGHDHVMHRLAELGLKKVGSITLPYFAVVAQTLAATDHISVVPRALADAFESSGQIRQFELPFHVDPGTVALYTYRRAVPSPPIDWVRGIITESLLKYPYPKYVVVDSC